jgi:hypothetical protein
MATRVAEMSIHLIHLAFLSLMPGEAGRATCFVSRFASAVPVRMTRGIASAFLMSVAALCGWLHCRQRLDPF